MPYRNGRELRDLLPLWKGNGRWKLLRRPVSGVREEMPYRNGRELRDLLPLWKDALWKGGEGGVKLVGRGKIEDGMGWWSDGGWSEDGVGRCRRKGNV